MTFTSAAPRRIRGPRLLKCLQVLQSNRTRLEKVRDEQPRGAAEELEEVAHQTAAELALIDRGLEELRVPDLAHFAQRPLLLETIDERLHRGVGDAFLLGQALENLAHRRGSELPVLLEDPRLGFRQSHAAPVYYISN